MKLTTNPSKLLRIALDDMKATVEQGYKIDMDTWGQGYDREEPKKCSVCFAGSVMLQRTQKDTDPKYFCTHDNNDENYDAYSFLDNIRTGELRIKIGGWRSYKKGGKTKFFAQVEELIKLLEKFPGGTKIIE